MVESAEVSRLLAAARAGSTEALGQLFKAYEGYLLVIARREWHCKIRSREGPEDVVQKSFEEAQGDFGQFTGDAETVLAWLRRILLNNLAASRRYDLAAKRRVTKERSLDADPESARRAREAADRTPGPEEQAITREEARAVRRALERLPEVYRLVLEWRYRAQLSFEEIGTLLDRTPNASRKVWARALERLRQELQGILMEWGQHVRRGTVD